MPDLQEAIAKAVRQLEAIRDYTERIPTDDRRGIDRDNLARAVAALDLLTQLHADDDTRYVAMDKPTRDVLDKLTKGSPAVLWAGSSQYDPRMQHLIELVAAYDALGGSEDAT